MIGFTRSWLSFCIILYSFTAASASLYTDIYRVLDANACVRLLNQDGTIGCSTPEGGTVGDLYLLNSNSDINDFCTNTPSDSKAVVMPSNLFNKQQMSKLRATGKLKGILLLYHKPDAGGWSPDTTNPNSQWGLNDDDGSFQWNPQGDGLNFVDIPFPIYALSEEESERILQLPMNVSGFPRYAVQFSTFMHATRDASTCLRRGQCMPLGGKSVWSSPKVVGSKPIVLAMANMDSTALIHDLATGADSTASGIAGLLGAAVALKNISQQTTFVNDIVYALWTGESWGYIGTRKFIDDIQHFTCQDYDASTDSCTKPFKPDLAFEKIKLQNISAVIELNQIGLTWSSNPPTLYVHQENSAANYLADLTVSVSDAAGLETKIQPVTATNAPGIPPSSLMTFLLANPSLPGIVITDHDSDYSNRNYHSHLDNGNFTSLNSESICDAATLLARTLYLLAINQTDSSELSSINADCDLVDQLVYCLATNFSCDLVSQFVSGPTIPTYYTGVFGWSISEQLASPAAVFAYEFLSLVNANNITATNCDNCADQCIAGLCITTPETHYHDALSLGIDWDYSSSMWKVVNASQPVWVESNWDWVGVQIFLRDNPTTEALCLTAGLIEFVISLVAVFYAKRYFLRNYKIF